MTDQMSVQGTNQEDQSYNFTQYLPRVFQQKAEETEADYFLGRFLKGFEAMLSGKTGAVSEESVGIEALLDQFHQYFDPNRTPSQFIPWLAGWLGLELEEGPEYDGEADHMERKAAPVQILPLGVSRHSVNRNLIGNIVQLYKKRGTMEGLKEILQVFAGEEVTIAIEDYEEPAGIGYARRIGLNAMVGAADPSYFSVHSIIPAPTRTLLTNKVRIIREALGKEKPFYTNASLNVEVPSMRVGVYGRIGRETLLGGMQEE
ncbi:phage tail protein [Paenibacillus sp. M1]|uniref:Phage tail protein n=1 Tax=Paenibacillus haidiansis TaxID=1574488 RepID=A0ABU7VVG0_9BACL